MTYYTLMFRIKTYRCPLVLRHSSSSALPPKGAGAESQWTVLQRDPPANPPHQHHRSCSHGLNRERSRTSDSWAGLCTCLPFRLPPVLPHAHALMLHESCMKGRRCQGRSHPRLAADHTSTGLKSHHPASCHPISIGQP